MTTSTNPKSLVMLDAAGKVATLKLTTSTGLHVYDGSMLWVNPAQTVTAAAPRATVATSQPTPGIHKVSKALPIVDPKTNEELVIPKSEAPPTPPVVPAQPTRPPPPTFTVPLGPLVGVSSAAPAPTITQMLANPTPSVPSAGPPPVAPQKEQNIIDLLAKATKQSPSALLAMATNQARGRGRDRELDRERSKGRAAKGGARAVQTEARGKGRNTRGVVPADSRRRPEVAKYSGDKYTKDAKYTASLDGRFWSLSNWPTGERDQDHRLTFGKHKLDILENGIVKIVLFGGVNKYKVRLHLCSDGDDLGADDKDGWEVATCEPSAGNLQLSDEASKLGWKIFKGGEHPLLYPPGMPLPETDVEKEKAAQESLTEVDKAASETQAEVSETKPQS